MDEIRKSDFDRDLFDRKVREAGSLRRLAAQVGVPAGTLSYIREGKRKPNASHRRKLIRAGLLPAPPKRVNWRDVAAFLATDWYIMARAIAHVTDDGWPRAEQLAKRIKKERER